MARCDNLWRGSAHHYRYEKRHRLSFHEHTGHNEGEASKVAGPRLARRLSLFDATMIVMGGIIGSGIFMNACVVARQVQTPLLILGAWVLGGAIAAVADRRQLPGGARRKQRAECSDAVEDSGSGRAHHQRPLLRRRVRADCAEHHL